MTQAVKLTKMDRRVLHELQIDGRISFAELARRVDMSNTQCFERVKRLEREGVIEGYTAIIDPEKVGANLVVFVQIRLSRNNQDIFEEFKQAAIALPEVQECYLVSGNFDYLIKARVGDMHAYRTFLGETLLTLPGVQESTSYVVMEEIKETLNLAI